MLTAITEHKIVKGDVVIIRYEGPRGGPGMREQLAPSAALVGYVQKKAKGKTTDV